MVRLYALGDFCVGFPEHGWSALFYFRPRVAKRR